MPASSIWTTQQLTEFLAVVSSVPEAHAARREALERAATALEAEVGAIVEGDEVTATVGFAAGAAPTSALLDAARAVADPVTLPAVGPCRTAVVPFEGAEPGLILLGRMGDEPFDRADVSVLRGMGRVLTLTLRMLGLVEEERALREESQRRAFTDSLTGLPNRALLLDRLDHALARAQRLGATATVLYIDLDRFKNVNDSLGHAAGDELLVAAAERISGVVRRGETVARLAGDEFAVLIEGDDAAREAIRVAERLAEALRAPFAIADREVTVAASIGIASGRGPAADLLRDADMAMYRAKRSGAAPYRVFHPDMHTETLERLELEADLERALARDELAVHYQPIVDLADGRTVGVEALVRWHHPQRGLVPPVEFIPIAEETGLIRDLGAWVLRTACEQVARWQAAAPGLRLSVNLSGRQLAEPGIAGLVCDAVSASGLAPGTLILELTETVLMQDTEASITRLASLKARDVQIAVDDFGTGYSSLRYLQRFPIDILKIAKPFVDELAGGGGDAILARAIADLSRNLGLDTIAEGIELPAQWDALRDLGCALGQGYLFSRPLDAAAMTDALAASRPTAARCA